jgi:hypothetical protein
MRARAEGRDTAGKEGREGVRGMEYQKREKAMFRRRFERSMVSSRVRALPCACPEEEAEPVEAEREAPPEEEKNSSSVIVINICPYTSATTNTPLHSSFPPSHTPALASLPNADPRMEERHVSRMRGEEEGCATREERRGGEWVRRRVRRVRRGAERGGGVARSA